MDMTSLIPQPWKRRGAFEGLPLLRSTFDRLFDEWFEEIEPFRALEVGNGFYLPKIDVIEDDKEITVTAELPGMDEKDIDIKLANDKLILKGEKKSEKEEKGRDFYRQERRYGCFRREIALPCAVAEDKVNAAFKKGVLTVTLPKTKEAQSEGKKIEIKAA